uniref:C3H1-type domain-containing protein n=1 Tax=Canya virus TaxID=2800909 RepID=A0A894KPD3_9VIRU|nr:MAG: hypothetical protein 4 [Canya virus]
MSPKKSLSPNESLNPDNKIITCVNIKTSGFCKSGIECPFNHPAKSVKNELYLDHMVTQSLKNQLLLTKIVNQLEKQTAALNNCAEAIRLLTFKPPVPDSSSQASSKEDIKEVTDSEIYD